MIDNLGKLRQFNEVWDERRLFTASIEFMLWYRLEDNVKDDRGMPEVEKSFFVMVDAIRPRISFFSKSESSRRSKPKKDTLDLFAHSLRNTKANELGGINQITLLNGGEHDHSDVFVDAHLTTFSYQRFGLSIEEVLADPAAYVELCNQAVAGIRFMSGIGGFSFNYDDVYINSNEHLCEPIIGRFKGVNVINPWRYRDMDGVPTVNCLTLVSNVDLERLGGFDAVTARLKSPVTIHRLPHGAMLQAGPKPLLGDVNEQESLDAYYAVGELLAPVRTTMTVDSDVAGTVAETTDWMLRFFRPPT